MRKNAIAAFGMALASMAFGAKEATDASKELNASTRDMRRPRRFSPSYSPIFLPSKSMQIKNKRMRKRLGIA